MKKYLVMFALFASFLWLQSCDGFSVTLTEGGVLVSPPQDGAAECRTGIVVNDCVTDAGYYATSPDGSRCAVCNEPEGAPVECTTTVAGVDSHPAFSLACVSSCDVCR